MRHLLMHMLTTLFENLQLLHPVIERHALLQLYQELDGPMPFEREDLFHCRMPYVTGTSVLGLTYKDGVLIASDMLGEPPVPMLQMEVGQ